MDHASRGCKSIRRLRTAPSVRAIGYEVFFDCDALEEAELAEGLEQIGVNALWDCRALQYVRIPSTVKAVVGVKAEHQGRMTMPCTIPTFIYEGATIVYEGATSDRAPIRKE